MSWFIMKSPKPSATKQRLVDEAQESLHRELKKLRRTITDAHEKRFFTIEPALEEVRGALMAAAVRK